MMRVNLTIGRHEYTITTEHAASSYGLPVVLRDGELTDLSVATFLADMGSRPSAKYTIERINNALGYSPDNCKWATQLEQCQNMRSTRLLTFMNRTLSVAAWARELGISRKTLQERLKKYSLEIALGTPKTPGGWNYCLRSR